MESVNVTIEKEIGRILYCFDAVIWYTDNSDPGDYWTPPYSDIEINEIELDSDITAIDEDGNDRILDESEESEIIDSIDWDSELEKKL